MSKIRTLLILFLMPVMVWGQKQDSVPPAKPHKWYDELNIRVYAQVRYNRLLETNPDLKCEQCDRSMGENGGISFRRVRVILFGNLGEHVYVYIQPDFAVSASSTLLNFVQLRDAYFDVSIDKDKEFRFRIGQSKVPFGFENLQSSQNRLALDRNDALNSAVSNERDLGVFFYWAPKKIRERFSNLVKSGLKGSGDYGVFALGTYTGQTANKPELNNSLHYVTRLSYPFEFSNGQILEAGVQAYTGKFVVSGITSGVTTINDKKEYLDQRAAASVVLYPQPIGFQAEANYGTGPRYNPDSNSIDQSKLWGGYAQVMYMLKLKKHILIPFVKFQYYDGGKKHELDARSYVVKETEIGVEWQPFKNLEVVAMYTISDRRFEDAVAPDNRQTGNLLRLQVQCNF